MQRILISVRETGALLGLGRTSVEKLRKLGLIETTKIGSRRLVFLASVHALLAQRTSGVEL